VRQAGFASADAQEFRSSFESDIQKPAWVFGNKTIPATHLGDNRNFASALKLARIGF
jgi:hypothetical protein